MEPKDLLIKDTYLYKKNGRYRNLIKAFKLYTNSTITNEGIVITKTFTDRIKELNENLIANTTLLHLIRLACYNSKMECFRKPFLEFCTEIIKMNNALVYLYNIHTLSVITEGEDNENNRPRNRAKALKPLSIYTVYKAEAMNSESIEKLKLIGINLPEELLNDPKVASLLGDINE